MSYSLPLPLDFSFQHLIHKIIPLAAVFAILCAASLPTPASAESSTAQRSTKRGLVDITTLSTAGEDNALLVTSSSDISWYYNYGSEATSSSVSSTSLEYVPMLWGSNGYSTFLSNVTTQLAKGANITSVIAFNEPDGCTGGGACMSATEAATIWKSQIEPLKASHGLKLGSPATTGSQQGIEWMEAWFTACDGGCNPDFLTAHYYGDFAGLASWLGQLNSTYKSNITGGIWVTEWADADLELNATQSFYNTSTEYMDKLEYVTRYAYFGAFRSDVSNIGAYATFFNNDGNLTDLGSWYIGEDATGVSPTSGTAATTTTTSSGATIYSSSTRNLFLGLVVISGMLFL